MLKSGEDRKNEDNVIIANELSNFLHKNSKQDNNNIYNINMINNYNNINNTNINTSNV